MPSQASHYQKKLQEHRLSKVALVILLLLVIISLGLWLYWSEQKKDTTRKKLNNPDEGKTVGTHR